MLILETNQTLINVLILAAALILGVLK